MANQENQWKRDLRQAQNPASQNSDPPQEEEEPMVPELPESELPKGTKEEEETKKGLAEKIRKLTAAALRSSVMQIVAFYGLAIWAWLYVGFHYIMSYMGGPFSSLFVRPGREWIKPIVDRMPVPEKIKKWTEETIGQIIEIFELMFTGCCCGSCLAVILLILFVLWIISSPCHMIQAAGFETLLSIARFFGFCKE